jgi:hypothetical protein
MRKDKTIIRDFVYLDWERVRSMAAQLFRGIPEGRTEGESREADAKGQLEGNALWLLKGQFGADYRYLRTENETRSFHHYVYSLVEDKLVDDKSLIVIDEDFDFRQWNQSLFQDGQFVRVKGLVRIMDYDWISMMLDALPQMYKTVIHMESLGLKQSQSNTQETAQKKKQHQDRLSELKALKLPEITAFIRQMYGDTVRIKVVANKEHKEKVFVGAGDPDNFHDTAASLNQKYGYEVDANWIVMGQVNISIVSEEPAPIPVGNQMEDMFEQVALMVSGLNRIATAVKFPSVSFTPVSIYREC